MTENRNSTQHKLEAEIQFLKKLYARIKLNPNEPEETQRWTTETGAKAALKRAISGEPRHIWRTYEFLPPIPEKYPNKKKQCWIPVACLSVFYPQPVSDAKQRQNFGYSCWRLQQEIQKDSPDAKGVAPRFQTLLDLPLEDLQVLLVGLVKQIKAKKKALPIDYPKLLRDLRQWEHPDQYVQDDWARSFWGAPTKEEGDEKDLPEDETVEDTDEQGD